MNSCSQKALVTKERNLIYSEIMSVHEHKKNQTFARFAYP